MSHITGFAVIPKGALNSFASVVTVTATTTKTVLETIHAARPTIPASLLQNTTAAYEQAAKQSALHGIVFANLNQMRPVVGLFLEGFIVSGGFYKLCERLAKVPPPSGENARYWRDKVKNTCTWLKRLFTSDERLRADLDKAHEEAAAAREEARRAREVDKNTTKELERKENLEGAYDKLYRERAELAMEIVQVEDKAKALQHDLDQSPNQLRGHIRSLEQRLSQSKNILTNAHLEVELEEVRGRADHLNEVLREQKTAYENKLIMAQSCVEEVNAALHLRENELQAVSILAEDRRAKLETKDIDLMKAQELVASLQQSLRNREQAAISSNKRADELQAQLSERNSDLQQAHAHAENLQAHINEQSHALQQAEAHTRAQQDEIDTAKSIEVWRGKLEQHVADYKQAFAEEVEKHEAALKQLRLLKTPQKEKSKISASIRALASPLEARFLGGISSSQPSMPHKQGHASPALIPTSGAKYPIRADMQRISDSSSRSSTPSKQASKKRRISALYTPDELDQPNKLPSSPPQPAISLPHLAEQDDAMDMIPRPTQPSSKPKLDLGIIPTPRPKPSIIIPVSATPSQTTRSRRADIPQESPSRKSARLTAKPLSYRESALAARSISPEKIVEEYGDERELGLVEVSPLKKSSRVGGWGGWKGKDSMGVESVAVSPRKKVVGRSVRDAGVRKR
ncbi:hypothetical protein FB567DRAFT_304653 [Paraphoma chrysanthemicola]|uniref:Uncharacterized protein n=1 Tax=Paraphoma chrysanthemicola TaxID=798071 RepID=A0A8K0VZT6_9PLEO|nr:hypothetical protein FB567DRAFT_304653 [Paraphoma chrysanthemicola]